MLINPPSSVNGSSEYINSPKFLDLLKTQTIYSKLYQLKSTFLCVYEANYSRFFGVKKLNVICIIIEYLKPIFWFKFYLICKS